MRVQVDKLGQVRCVCIALKREFRFRQKTLDTVTRVPVSEAKR